MAALDEPTAGYRIYRFGQFIERTVFLVIILGLVILGGTVLLDINLPNRNFLFLLSGLVAAYTLIYHHFVYFKDPTVGVAFLDSLVYSVFIFLLNYATGGISSPLFFLYLLPIISVRLNLGSTLPIAVTFYIAALNLFQLFIQSNPDPTSLTTFLSSFYEQDIYRAATNITSILLVGAYIRSISIELTTEHEQSLRLDALNRELKRINHGKDEFISIASHQIRTPLTAIRGGLTAMIEGTVGAFNKDQKKFLSQILEEANHLEAVAEDSLDVALMEDPHFTLHLREFDQLRLVRMVQRNFKEKAENKNVHLEVEKPIQSLPNVLADDKAIESVLANLVDNAIKFTPSGGKVTIKCISSGGKVITSVTDSGIGIPKEEIHNLFQKFYKVANVLNDSAPGSGLGLYLTKLIMSLHGETIWVESELGKGSTFTFTLKAVPHK